MLRFRFSIRLILAVIFIAACLAAAYRFANEPLVMQNKALEQLRKDVKKRKPAYYPMELQPPLVSKWEYYPWWGREKRAQVLTKADFCAYVDNGQDDDVYQIVLTDDDMPLLGHFFELRHLDLEGSTITDDGLKHLKNLKKLTHLNLSGTKVRGDGFVHLAKLPSLKELILNDLTITGEGLAALGESQSLETVGRCSVVDLSGEQWSKFVSNPELTRLRFDVLSVDELKIQYHPRLDELRIDHGSLKHTDICNSPLRTIHVGEGSSLLAESFSLDNLPLLKRVRNDNLVGRMHLQKCKSLEEVYLNRFENVEDVFRDLPRLRNLNVRDCEVTEATFQEIAGLQKLRSLRLALHHDDRVLTGFENLQELEELYLTGVQLTDETIRKLAKLPRLKTLFIAGAVRPDLELGTAVERWKRLKSLTLHDCQIKSCKLIGHRRLTRFRTRGCRLGQTCLQQLPMLTSTGHGDVELSSLELKELPKVVRLTFEFTPGTVVEKMELHTLPRVSSMYFAVDGWGDRRRPPDSLLPKPKIPQDIFVPGAQFPRMRPRLGHGTLTTEMFEFPGCEFID